MPQARDRILNRYLHAVLRKGGAQAFSKSCRSLSPLMRRVGGLSDGGTGSGSRYCPGSNGAFCIFTSGRLRRDGC